MSATQHLWMTWNLVCCWYMYRSGNPIYHRQLDISSTCSKSSISTLTRMTVKQTAVSIVRSKRNHKKSHMFCQSECDCCQRTTTTTKLVAYIDLLQQLYFVACTCCGQTSGTNTHWWWNVIDPATSRGCARSIAYSERGNQLSDTTNDLSGKKPATTTARKLTDLMTNVLVFAGSCIGHRWIEPSKFMVEYFYVQNRMVLIARNRSKPWATLYFLLQAIVNDDEDLNVEQSQSQ